MAITSVGYDGPVDEPGFASLMDTVGHGESVESGFDLTTLTTPDRAVRLSAGVASGHGVRDVSDANVTVQAATVGSGSRWDTVVLRRDWAGAGGTTTVAVVSGTSAKAVAPGIESTPGESDDQPLYLIRVQAGSSTIVEVQDVRVRASKVLTVPDLVALPNAPLGTVAEVGGRRYTRVTDSSGNPIWTNFTVPWTTIGGPTDAGWSHENRLHLTPTHVTVQIELLWSGGTFTNNELSVGGSGLPAISRPDRTLYFPINEQQGSSMWLRLLEISAADGRVRIYNASGAAGRRWRGTFTYPRV